VISEMSHRRGSAQARTWNCIFPDKFQGTIPIRQSLGVVSQVVQAHGPTGIGLAKQVARIGLLGFGLEDVIQVSSGARVPINRSLVLALVVCEKSEIIDRARDLDSEFADFSISLQQLLLDGQGLVERAIRIRPTAGSAEEQTQVVVGLGHRLLIAYNV